ncbi:MAG: DUF1223 domain-containing protein [Reyranella sp.]|uniref:DUF1223 domain-containing protein n=1 Tax=Reyranella sp. TaxID=1929291 RepID=UPI001AC1722C|nr:DUF1223 domain-containing protein [Reyranella sp.]MBN9087290.1 DUF1223 domain-containing protein [Reyranella sp.]
MLIGGAGLLVGADAAAESRPGQNGGPWAIELFTSQGCSSCPPADAMLGRLAQRPDIVALSFHVDYWDYIGWKDRFATKETTARQRAYARTLRQKYIYTPEMVVDGRVHQPGISDGQIESMLANAKRQATARTTPMLKRVADGTLRIALDAAKIEGPADVALFVYDRRHATPIQRGENEGRRLDNFNVVRHFEVLGQWDGAQAHWTVAADRFQPEQGLAAIVQQPDHGPVLGANKLEPVIAG